MVHSTSHLTKPTQHACVKLTDPLLLERVAVVRISNFGRVVRVRKEKEKKRIGNEEVRSFCEGHLETTLLVRLQADARELVFAPLHLYVRSCPRDAA